MLFLPDGRGAHRGRNGEGKRKQVHQPLLRSELRRPRGEHQQRKQNHLLRQSGHQSRRGNHLRGEHQQRKQNHLLRQSGHQSRRGNHLRLQIPIRRQGTGVSVWSEKLCGKNELSCFCYYVEEMFVGLKTRYIKDGWTNEKLSKGRGDL